MSDIYELIRQGSFSCECGKTHSTLVEHIIIEHGAVRALPDLLREYGSSKPFLLSGSTTFKAAGEPVTRVLDEAGITCSRYIFPEPYVQPTEKSVGSALMHFDFSCDGIGAVGSGVINDIAKLLAAMSGLTYIVVGTPPSMDG